MLRMAGSITTLSNPTMRAGWNCVFLRQGSTEEKPTRSYPLTTGEHLVYDDDTPEASHIELTLDYGLKPPSALLGTIGTKNEMEFSFSLELR
jgi:hypothetical protein